jgi:hypothetical protein
MVIRRVSFLLGFLATVLVIAGCATAPEKRPFDKSLRRDLRTIALLNIDELTKYIASSLANSGRGLGLVGGLASEMDMKDKSKQFTELVHKYIQPLGSHLKKSLADRLRLLGYEVKQVDVVRKEANALISDYSKIKVDADAILDVVIFQTGYASEESYSVKYEPVLTVMARMVSAKSKEVLYSEFITYGHKLRRHKDEWVHIPARRNLVYTNFESLLKDGKQAAEELATGTESVAEYLAKNLSN